MKIQNYEREPGSFRDPAGQIFIQNGILYRQINKSYLSQYRSLMNGGLYEELIEYGAMIPHRETQETGISQECACVIEPYRVPFVSYPYEWSFGELRDAAILTLKIHRRAMRHGMILKDASAYNIQFVNGAPVFIDTLSFDFYRENMPWVAYGQFCRHFLAPLLLMCEVDVRLSRLLSVYIDGLPLDLAAVLLKGKGGFFAKQHIQWHAQSIQKHAQDGKIKLRQAEYNAAKLTKDRQLALIEGLIHGIEALDLKNVSTEWGNYYAQTNYSSEAAANKERIVREYLRMIKPGTVWDLGANDGTYSKIALEQNAHVVAFDIDPIAVEKNYNAVKQQRTPMLPLLLDLTNPSPGIGFANEERKSIEKRQQPDCVMALALVHHLAIANNLPLPWLADWLARLGRDIIIEFVPKEDSQAQILLATREDIFPDYSQEGFERAFSRHYVLKDKQRIGGTLRTLYYYHKNS